MKTGVWITLSVGALHALFGSEGDAFGVVLTADALQGAVDFPTKFGSCGLGLGTDAEMLREGVEVAQAVDAVGKYVVEDDISYRHYC